VGEHIVSLSGGKDSTAMLLRMIELYYPIDKIIFADTKLEFPEMYEHLDRLDEYCVDKLGFGIMTLRTNDTFDNWFYGEWTRGQSKGEIRGFPKVKDPCYWSRESKFKILDSFIEKDDVRYLGIAIDEYNRKQDKKGYEYPLIDWGWTERDCRDFLKKNYPQFYPPFLKKFGRTGCWLCPKQSQKSLEILYNHYPKLWEKLKKYDQDSPHNFKPNKTIKELEEMFETNKMQMSMFI
jgi:3'-phosphoadenosine 5'-phosphosulfate sulfotransferase (PAPS reductase)/FAD synthetase